MKKYFDANKKLWDKAASINANSKFYSVEKFKQGKSSLNYVELEALGNVKGKSILHLQCHFGQDTLSLARMGANITGVDFSSEAISLANKLKIELKLNADFICCNIYDLKKYLNKKFDIVYTSYGVIGWLPDLGKWAEIISSFLKPSGMFFMVEFHPFIWMFDNKIEKIKYPYFNSGVIKEKIKGIYSDRNANMEAVEYGWNHALSEVFSSLTGNGLQINEFNEFPFSFYNCFPNMIKGKDGYFRIKHLKNYFPLMYSIKAVK